MIRKMLILVSIMSLLSACGSAAMTVSAPDTLPTQASACIGSEWSLEFHRTGGFAGFDENLTLNSDGKLAVNSRNPETDFERTLPLDEVQRITNQLEAACPFEAASKADNCADCFGYTLTVDTGNKTYRLEGNDVTLTDEQSALLSSLQGYFNPQQ